MARQRGDYLTLTLSLLSALAAATRTGELDTGGKADGIENRLVNSKEILMSIGRPGARNTGLNAILRVFKR